jgi:hypothetical protein
MHYTLSLGAAPPAAAPAGVAARSAAFSCGTVFALNADADDAATLSHAARSPSSSTSRACSTAFDMPASSSTSSGFARLPPPPWVASFFAFAQRCENLG